ncbi:hypothetical protein GCM10010123_46600 [Pilimelia anulata]|uniref:Uncharacterized protein n=1 Tax=Pilimelia anulata TaxID=53371 RepID=A0A8J3FDT4_9ACTN|nr:hypothetical protein [Pilimelia anulata]GGK11328.1 hypothetical protein GCM10010123_46600 [Pilimelia anulata]
MASIYRFSKAGWRRIGRSTAVMLGVEVTFHPRVGGGDALFVSQTHTRGEGTHTDVTLWFVVAAAPTGDPAEFRRTRLVQPRRASASSCNL